MAENAGWEQGCEEGGGEVDWIVVEIEGVVGGKWSCGEWRSLHYDLALELASVRSSSNLVRVNRTIRLSSPHDLMSDAKLQWDPFIFSTQAVSFQSQTYVLFYT